MQESGSRPPNPSRGVPGKSTSGTPAPALASSSPGTRSRERVLRLDDDAGEPLVRRDDVRSGADNGERGAAALANRYTRIASAAVAGARGLPPRPHAIRGMVHERLAREDLSRTSARILSWSVPGIDSSDDEVIVPEDFPRAESARQVVPAGEPPQIGAPQDYIYGNPGRATSFAPPGQGRLTVDGRDEPASPGDLVLPVAPCLRVSLGA